MIGKRLANRGGSSEYANGTFVQNGVTKLLATTNVTANTNGVITQQVNGGVVVKDATSDELTGDHLILLRRLRDALREDERP